MEYGRAYVEAGMTAEEYPGEDRVANGGEEVTARNGSGSEDRSKINTETREGPRHRTVPVGCAVLGWQKREKSTAMNGGGIELRLETIRGSRHRTISVGCAVMVKRKGDK